MLFPVTVGARHLAHVLATGSVAPKWILLFGTLFLLMGAVLQATIELARYAKLASAIGVALKGSFTSWAGNRYDAFGSNIRIIFAGELGAEYWKAFRDLFKQVVAFSFWPYVWPFVLGNLVRDALDVAARSAVDDLKRADLKAAGLRAAGWWLVVAGATLAFAAAIVDLLVA